MGKQEFNTDFAEMLMGLMSSGLKAMVQRIYEMLMSMEVDSKLKAGKSERTEGRTGYRSQAQQASTTRVSARWGYRKRRWEPAAKLSKACPKGHRLAGQPATAGKLA